MKKKFISILTNPEELNTFTSSIARETGGSRVAILETIAQTLTRQQRLRGDDLAEVLSIGRVRLAVAAALDGLSETSAEM